MNHHTDNAISQLNETKTFVSSHSRSVVLMKLKAIFISIVTFLKIFVARLSSTRTMYSINLTLFIRFTWNSLWNIFFYVTRVLKCLWSPLIILYTLLDILTQNTTQCHHVLFSFKGTSIGYVHHSRWIERHIVSKTQNNIWLIYFSPDVDECSADFNPCDDNADCSNTEGSYSCGCKLGFSGDGRTCKGS